MIEKKIMISNQDDDNVFAVVVGEDLKPKIQVKQGRGKNAYKFIYVDEAVTKIQEAINQLRVLLTTEL